MVIGYHVETTKEDDYLEKLAFVCSDRYGSSKLAYYEEFLQRDYSNIDVGESEEIKILLESSPVATSGGPMDSAWPMKCHDLHHTGRSPYSTIDTWDEKWRFETDNWVEGGSVIGDDGTIYFGCFDRYLYALYPDGSLKWKYKLDGWIWSTPAIDADGIVYIGCAFGLYTQYLYAIYPNGTLKWKFSGVNKVTSSPAVGEDGIIYFGDWNGWINALNPNGTDKWRYKTGDWITSDPAIGDDGTVYIGSADGYLYAMYPNGTLHWRFKTGDWIKAHPSIADDGTIYFGSFDGYLYALYPNGTVKWKFNNPGSGCVAAVIAEDGTLYLGGDKLYAINPNGTLKWNFNLGERRYISHSSPAISADGTIYVGTNIGETAGGEIIAVNIDGTERWRKKIADEWVDSSPSIAEDGTVYIGSSSCEGGDDYGYLHAFGPQETNDPPTAPSITGPLTGKAGTSYDYKFVATDPDRNPVSYYVKWGDDTHTGWTGDYNTGEEITLSHAWNSDGTFTIKAKARDTFGAEGPEASLTVTMPRNRAFRFIDMFPLLERLLSLIRV
jgi:outer membrane protein assembly factor BamB